MVTHSLDDTSGQLIDDLWVLLSVVDVAASAGRLAMGNESSGCLELAKAAGAPREIR